EGPRARSGGEQSERMGVAVQHLACEDGQQHRIRPAHEAGQRQEQEDGADRAITANVIPALAQLLDEAGSRPAAAAHGRDAHAKQRGDHGEVQMPSMRKHHPSPNAAMMKPPIAGPIRRAPLTIEELMAMALARSLRSSTI